MKLYMVMALFDFAAGRHATASFECTPLVDSSRNARGATPCGLRGDGGGGDACGRLDLQMRQ